MKKVHKEYLQSALFGFNDALVSTTGVIVGVSTGTSDKQIVILVGLVAICVEALSMGSGEYLSSRSVNELEKNYALKTPVISGLIMFASYFVAGLVPLIPVILLPVSHSRNVAIIAAFIGLVLLGYIKGRIVNYSPVRSAVESLVVGGIATVAGIVVGRAFGV